MLILEHILGFGFFMFAFFCLTSYNNEFKKWRIPLLYNRLKQMQDRWGIIPGTFLHVLAYVLTPVGFGILFIMGFIS